MPDKDNFNCVIPINDKATRHAGQTGKGSGNGIGIDGDPSPTITQGDKHAVAYDMRGNGNGETVNSMVGDHASRPTDYTPIIQKSMQVRRLTPEECETLQGFPRGYTNIPWRGKPTSPDGPRYKALGNSMAVPVIKWIGERIQAVELIANKGGA